MIIHDEPRLDVLDHADLPPSVAWQAVTFMRCTWPGLFDGGLRWIDSPFSANESPTYVVVRRGDVVLAHAAVIRVPVIHDGTLLDVAGLGCVFTLPPYRGEGHAGRVLEEVRRIVDTCGADAGGLFCADHLRPFYERFGWVACPGGTREGGAAEDGAGEDGAGEGEPVADLRMMRFVSPAAQALAGSLTTTTLQVPWAW